MLVCWWSIDSERSRKQAKPNGLLHNLGRGILNLFARMGRISASTYIYITITSKTMEDIIKKKNKPQIISNAGI